jgi:hypothetical protein
VIRVVFILLFAVQSAAAQSRDTRTWYQAYSDAQRKIQQRNWEGALADLDAATRLGAPRPGRNINFYGDVYRDLNPDYYRGVALTNLKRFEEADQAFERVRQAGLIGTRDALYAEFNRLSASVKENVNTRAANASSPPGRSSPTTPDAGPGVNASRPPVGVNPSGIEPAGVNASGINAAGINVAGVDPTVQGPPPNMAAANVDPAPAAGKQPMPDPRTQAGAKAPAPAINRPPNSRIGTPTARPADPIAVSGARNERAAIVRYFSGDYSAAEAALRGIAGTDGATPRTYLYLACSQAALVLTGRSPRSMLDDARVLVRQIGDTGPLSRDLALISPRIRQELGLRP